MNIEAAALADREITWAVRVAERYSMIAPNNVYRIANNFSAKLDVYVPEGVVEPMPTVVYFHGGGWMVDFNKEMFPFSFLPFLTLGWNVVSVEYRPSSVSLAPAAIEDCLCALRWVGRNARQYSIDTTKIVLMGHSSGGHLALTSGMIPLTSSGLGAPAVIADMGGPPADDMPAAGTSVRPAAIVNWFGVTDVADLIEGSNLQGYAVAWLGNQPDRMALAKLASPLSYVREGLPPIISVHGDNDPLVPHSHAVRLHEALKTSHVTNKLITIPGGGHGQFGIAATRDAWVEVLRFLSQAGLTAERGITR
jgi:acetyl esterase/lipase